MFSLLVSQKVFILYSLYSKQKFHQTKYELSYENVN